MTDAVDRKHIGIDSYRSLADRPLSDLVLVCPDVSGDARWRAGERLNQLFEQQCDRLCADGRGSTLAVDADGGTLTYHDLDSRANQLARHLLSIGIRGGHRVALLFDDPVQSYIAILAVLKANAAYVRLWKMLATPCSPARRSAR